jgi:hypothetical protein
MLAKNSDKFPARFDTLNLLGLPNSLTKLQLHVQELALNISPPEVLLSLPQELDKNYACELIML